MSQKHKTTDYDLLVIGAGSGGSTVAIEAAARGASCAVFEHCDPGGTCVHRGCVPKKLLWHAADIIHHSKLGPAYGIDSNKSIAFDYPTWRKHSRRYIDAIGRWFTREFESKGAQLVPHHAEFVDEHTLVADGKYYTGKHIVIAAGSQPNRPSFPGADLVMTSDEFFAMEQLDKRMAIVGSGYIAIELACALNSCGVDVSLVVRRDRLSSQFDGEMVELLAEHLIHQGITILWQHQCQRVDRQADGSLQLGFADDRPSLNCDSVIWAIGRHANTADLGLGNTRLSLDDKGFIATDINQATNIDHIYALGDIAGRFLLTPVAIRAARYLVRRLYNNEDACFDYSHIASAVYAHPPFAYYGLREDEARRDLGDDVSVWRSRFSPLVDGMGGANNSPKSLIKLICQSSTDRILGLHILAPAADEMMQGFAVALTMGATKADFDRCVAIHPTVAEEVVTLK